ncbi:NGFI-A-binding protein homolog [Condylostylus longicornis]|uniref:NGFI-A-binding protein homolog n=1 Tax=Condylostylus longicornis TaxID=2530218 RepID=UPI00244E3EAD|nr:NGFI-A-binding protein homolog [Condylostylus longicornis]
MDHVTTITTTPVVSPTSSVVASGNILAHSTKSDDSKSLINAIASCSTIPVITPSSTISNISSTQISSNICGTSSSFYLPENPKSTSIILSSTPSPILSPPGKIFGKNINGTVTATSVPSNEAELQLYRVLQRASLLSYYDTLLEMGGDDVQQLCDAGEEEFLEIMALVGMASKPLHVRRLQKALHEWTTNPSIFQVPLSSSSTGIPEVNNSFIYNTPETSSLNKKLVISPSFNLTSLINNASTSATLNVSSCGFTSLTATGLTSQVTSSSPQLTPVLTESQICKIAQIAEKMCHQIPQKEPKQLNSKKRATKDLEQVMTMNENDPRRMEEIRKYAAIYGRFDCKRRPEKPLTLHEVCVNEAAAQICKYVPALLTRRDELFPLARQLVKDAGFGHSASIARYLEQQQQQEYQQKLDDSDKTSNMKKPRLSSIETTEAKKDILEDNRINLLAMYHKLTKQHLDLADMSKFSFLKSDCEEEIENDDSRLSFSTCSSPLQFEPESEIINQNIMENDKNKNDASKSPKNYNDDKICLDIASSPIVISAAGSHIIAVANPALVLSPTLNEGINVKRESNTPDIYNN